MNRLVLSLVCLVLVLPVIAQNKTKKQAVIDFSKKEIDFKTIHKSETKQIRDSIVISNTGNKTMIINYIAATCKCVQLDVKPNTRVKPNSSLTLHIAIDVDKKSVAQYLYQIAISSSASNYPYYYIPLKLKLEV